MDWLNLERIRDCYLKTATGRSVTAMTCDANYIYKVAAKMYPIRRTCETIRIRVLHKYLFINILINMFSIKHRNSSILYSHKK